MTLAVYLLNGTSDQVDDRANGSSRPIASGRLQPATAVGVALLSAPRVALGGLLTSGAGGAPAGQFLLVAAVTSLCMCVGGLPRASPTSGRPGGTLPVRRGTTAAGRLTSVLALALAAGGLAAGAAVSPDLLLAPIGLSLGAAALMPCSIYRPTPANSTDRDARLPYRIFMATQYAVHSTIFLLYLDC